MLPLAPSTFSPCPCRRWLPTRKLTTGMRGHRVSARAATRLEGWRVRANADGQGPGGLPTPEPLPGQESQQWPSPVAEQELDPNVWAYKPAWCQPWTIVGTGAAFVTGVWAISGGSLGWMAASAVPVVAWWYLFLGIYPAQFKEYAEAVNAQQQEQQRKQQQWRQG